MIINCVPQEQITISQNRTVSKLTTSLCKDIDMAYQVICKTSIHFNPAGTGISL